MERGAEGVACAPELICVLAHSSLNMTMKSGHGSYSSKVLIHSFIHSPTQWTFSDAGLRGLDTKAKQMLSWE